MMRVTEKGLLRMSLQHIQHHFSELSRNQEMLASGIRVDTPSKDPVATQRILRWRTIEDGITQYERNINTTKIWMNTTESALDSISSIMEKIHEVALQGGNAIIPQDVREGFTEEVEALLKSIINLANTSVENNYLFAGDTTDTVPFTAVVGGGVLPALLITETRASVI